MSDRSRLFPARESTGTAMVWFHGGGWVGGELDWPESSWVAAGLAERGVTTVAATYRKAVDGVHYPVPLDDVVGGWTDAVDETHTWFIGGASAGANLAAGAVLRLRDEAAALPAGMVLAYPLLHAELPEFSPELVDTLATMPDDGWVFTEEMARGFTSNYVGDAALDTDPYAFPANASLAGLPPTFIANAEFDTLRASSERFAELLRGADVDVTDTQIAGTYHGFLNEPSLVAASDALDAMANWCLTRPFARSPRS